MLNLVKWSLKCSIQTCLLSGLVRMLINSVCTLSNIFVTTIGCNGTRVIFRLVTIQTWQCSSNHWTLALDIPKTFFLPIKRCFYNHYDPLQHVSFRHSQKRHKQRLTAWWCPLFWATCKSCPRESTPNSLIAWRFSVWSCFFLALSLSVIFYSESARNKRYCAYFVAFIRLWVVIHEPFKKASKAALTSRINIWRKSWESMIV